MTTDIEQLGLNGVELNDGRPLVVEGDSFKFTSAEKKPQFVSNPDTDGEVLVEEAHYGNATFEFDVAALSEPGGGSVESRVRLNQLVEQLLQADRNEGGVPLIWTPSGSPNVERINRSTNPSGETTKILTDVGADTVTTRTLAGAAAKSGVYVTTSTANGVGTNMGYQSLAFPGAGTYMVSIYVNLNEGWDGGNVKIACEGYVGGTQVEVQQALESNGPGWQRVICQMTVVAGDLVGNIVVRSSKAPTAGKVLLADAFMVNGGELEPYFDGDWPGCAWSGTAHASTSTRFADAYAYTWYVLLGEINDVPVTQQGDDAGWFFEEPKAKIKLICRPFGYRKERVVKVATESAAAPLQEIYAKVGGHVPAEAVLVVTDKATVKRRYAEWGLENTTSEAGNPQILFKGDDLIIAGYAAKEKKATTNDWSTTSIFGTAAAQGQAACSTPVLAHVGSYRVKLRAREENSVTTRPELMWRVAYRVGDGPWGYPGSGEWQGPLADYKTWCEIDLGEVIFRDLEKGTQRSEVRVEVKYTSIALGGTPDYYIDTLTLIPTRRYGRARGAARLDPPTVLAAYDDLKGSGNLTASTLNIGGTWAGAGDPADFTYFEGNGERTAVSDEADISKGRIVTANGTTAQTDQVMSAELWILSSPGETLDQGVVCRADGTVENFFAAYISFTQILYVTKRVAGVTTLIAGVSVPKMNIFTPYKITLICLAGGMWYAAFGLRDTPESEEIRVSGFDAVLGAGGALDNGRVGLIDHYTSGSAAGRMYLKPSGWIPNVPSVIETSQSLEVRSNSVEREDSGGTYWGNVPEYRGGFFYLDPEGPNGQFNRIVVRARRGDIVAEPDENILDKQTVEVLARERVLYPLK